MSAVTPRPLCLRCRRPASLCYCRHLPTLPTRTRIVLLQHPREAKMAVGTARMAHLALPNSELHQGVLFHEHPRVTALLDEPGTALLFPGEGATDPRDLAPEQVRHLIVVDGTWAQAKKVVKENPMLLRLPRVGLTPEKPGNYRIRKEPRPDCLSTIEAVSSVLGVLEGDQAKFEAMLAAFTFMVDQQIIYAASRTEPRRQRRRLHAPSEEDRLLAALPNVVLLAMEVNAHSRHLNVPGKPELLHLVAQRLNGERFEATLAPRRPLAMNAPFQLDVPLERLLAGETIETTRTRWQAFLQPTDLLAGWGGFTTDLLAREELAMLEYFDLRLVVARRFQKSPGSPAAAVARLGGAAPRPTLSGRAGRTVAALEQLVAALAAQPARWRMSA